MDDHRPPPQRHQTLAHPRFGTVECWRLSSAFHHPVHLHMAHFQVLSRGGRRPEASEAGWRTPSTFARTRWWRSSPASTAITAATCCTAT
ncbi:multicopper oxidase domain-containing protein [Streptomyces griseoluteus]|uniref:multicopper oxidase domain-containing protein n=1 Tax=Streptomyces griseoluteus TaxID=29306 RepID=UPI0036FD7876